ncbi:MAG: bifunctional riboflavin kinase/FAD synthetase [Candidatus Omnitrophica bacterium]|jgi:riboflavin kinase/FMN adenylyltransferase|nr:bifunctional riboflavin kinase/FAD synthetase [Candidatus Omnitrophota bacterium]
MKVFYYPGGMDKEPKPSAVAVGVFDGFHSGHKKILGCLLNLSRKKRLRPVVVTFFPHPDNVLSGRKKALMLCSLKHRLRLFSDAGISLCVVLKFDRVMAEMPCDVFIKQVLIDGIGMRSLVAGEGFCLGKERSGSNDGLKEIAARLGFGLRIVSPKRHKKRIISSSIIRRLIERGDIKQAAKLLNRPVSVLGTVIHGRKKGRKIGFRTANIDPHHEVIPPRGVYAAYTVIGTKTYKSVVNIGQRPTFDGKEANVETHIFGLRRNIYGKDIEICFIKKLRPEIKFKDQALLGLQIKKDILRAKGVL